MNTITLEATGLHLSLEEAHAEILALSLEALRGSLSAAEQASNYLTRVLSLQPSLDAAPNGYLTPEPITAPTMSAAECRSRVVSAVEALKREAGKYEGRSAFYYNPTAAIVGSLEYVTGLINHAAAGRLEPEQLNALILEEQAETEAGNYSRED